MSGEPTEPVEQTAAPEQSTSAFMAGYDADDDAARPTETPAPAPETPPEPAPAPTPAPEFVQVTRQDWERINASAAKVDEITAAIGKMPDQIYGTMGRTLDRRLAELQQATPQGAAVEVDPENFAELKEQFPELAELTLKGLNKALSKLKGTGDIDKMLEGKLAANRVEIGRDALDAVYPDWQQDINTPDFAQFIRSAPGGEHMPLDKASRDKALADPSSMLSQYVRANPSSDVARACSAQLRDAAALMRSFYGQKKAAPAPTAPPAAPTPTAAPAAQLSMRQRQTAAAIATRGEAGPPPAAKGKSPFLEGYEQDD